MAEKFLVTNRELVIKTNEESNFSSIFLRTLDTFAVYVTRQSTRRQKFFRKRNIALAIQKRSNSFTFIAKDENNFLGIQTADGEVTSQNSLATFSVPQSLLTRAKNTQIYSYIYRSGPFFHYKQKMSKSKVSSWL